VGDDVIWRGQALVIKKTPQTEEGGRGKKGALQAGEGAIRRLAGPSCIGRGALGLETLRWREREQTIH